MENMPAQHQGVEQYNLLWE
jgi:hypothetical protein